MAAYAPSLVGSIVCTAPPFRNANAALFPVSCIQIAWTAGVGGAVTAQTPLRFNGQIMSIITEPTVVTTAYAVTLKNRLGVNTIGAAAARSTANNELVAGTSPNNYVDDQLWLEITGATAGDTGNVWVYLH
jgi:hypothetical protein